MKHCPHRYSSSAVTILATVALGLMLSIQLQAQTRALPHGFRSTYPGSLAIGIQTGANWNYGINGPRAACSCEFDNGTDLGYHVGIHFDFLINRWFGLRLQGLYEDASTVYTKSYVTESYVSDGGLTEVNAERRAEVGAQYAALSFHAIWFTGPGGLYLLSGAEAGFFLDGSYLEEEYIVAPAVVYAQTGSNRMTFRDEALDANEDVELRAGLVFGVGYDIALGKGLGIAPELQISYPITSVVAGNANWRIPIFRGSFVFRFGI